MRPSAQGRPVPVAGQWVVLHRVGSDRAGPLDSARSNADGRFRIRYAPFGIDDALYFVSARYGGIAYFSPPLRADTVRGDDADVMVYDTTPDTSTLRVQGRHFVLSAPRGKRREVAEVFEIENEGTHTVVSRDSVTPVWTTHLPAAAESASVGPGDIGAGAVVFRKGSAEIFAPISPGVRQLVLTYLLPADAFPLSLPLERPVSVFEVLLPESRAKVEGARLTEVAPANIDGRPFRRFLAQDVPRTAVVRVDAPQPAAGQNRGAMRVLAIVVALVMISGLAWVWLKRRGEQPYVVRRTSSRADPLIAELATLDARFERGGAPDVDARGAYDRERAELKARIERALAEEKQPA
jgi:hypothetical protein